MINKEHPIIIGAREVIHFPQLGIQLRAKVDTGARTSSLHARNISLLENKQGWIQFTTLDESSGQLREVMCQLPLHDRRKIRSSNGQSEWRYVVQVLMQLGPLQQKIQLTLADRTRMKYSMLLGRSAMKQHLLVAPGAAYLFGTS